MVGRTGAVVTPSGKVMFVDGDDGWRAFDWLIAPVERERFLDDVWEQQPCVIARDDPTYFSALVSSADVDTIAAMFRVAPRQEDGRTQTVRLVRFDEGGPTSGAVIGAPDGTPDWTHLYRAYARGSTIILGPLGSRWPPVAELCAQLESALHHRVSANLYLTPAGAQGFPRHHDTHDVFIVQVEGTKSWRVHEPRRHLPLIDVPWDDLTPAVDGTRDIELSAGDVLYMPRGWLHEARAGSGPSLHVTIGIHVVRWTDILADVVRTALAEREPRVRYVLAPGYLRHEQAPEIRDRVRALLAELAASDDATIDAAMALNSVRFLRVAQPPPGGHFVALAERPELSLDSTVRLVTRMCRVTASDDAATIQIPGRHLRYPAFLASVLQSVATARTFRVGELPGGLSDDAKLVLARRLVQEGVLGVAPRAH